MKVLTSLKNNKNMIIEANGLYDIESIIEDPEYQIIESEDADKTNEYWPAPDNQINGPYDYKTMVLGEKKKNEKLYKVNKRFFRLKKQWKCGKQKNNDINCDYIVLLNKSNSKIIEEAIKKDSGYIQFSKRIYEYEKIMNNNVFPRDNKQSILALVRMIDIENSTQVWRYDRNALNRMVDFICNSVNNFWDKLESGDVELVDKLTEASKDPSNVKKRSNGKKSLASKICKYLAEFEYKKYHYYINDSFVRKVVIPYVHYYMSKKDYDEVMEMGAPDSWSYKQLFDVLDKLHKSIECNLKSSQKINRSCFDHIMWYCYKESGDKE